MTQEIKDVGIPEIFREECRLTGTDGNIFALLGTAQRHLRDQTRQWEEDEKLVYLQEEPGEYFRRKAKEMADRVMKSHSYDAALNVIMEYVVAV